MLKFTHTKNLKDYIGKEVTIVGFAQTIRLQSKIIFIILRDITGTIQVVFQNDADSIDYFKLAQELTLESVIKVEGLVKEERNAPNGFEIQAKKLERISRALPELPIPVVVKGGEETDAPIRLDYRWLDLRKPEKAKIFKVWTEFEKGWRKYWNENNFIQLYPPALMPTPSEGGAEVFEVNYFDRKAYLAQSPQFYKQMAMAAGFEKVFMVSPVFRAEPSFTTRHLTEFTGWDFEISYIENLQDVMSAEEGMIVSGFKQLLETFPDLGIVLPTRPFPRISMVEVKTILLSLNVPSPEEHDLSPEEERAISEYVLKEHNHEFVFITDYHKSKSAFYHMCLDEDSGRSRRADLLYRGIEVTTLAQREHRLEILEKQAKEKGMDLEPLKDYLNFFRYGCPPHGGAGIGPGRFIMKILNLPNVREATYLPRDVKRLNP
ncbi:MAG: aspartate--tRNA(Asn) ligase [bacterium]|nr:aspartate--tRNA(Asn) ligase [bacterium]MDZ4205693.1 aspartate--tRNA(Asn) ligase [Patescibacteria group bacterium]